MAGTEDCDFCGLPASSWSPECSRRFFHSEAMSTQEAAFCAEFGIMPGSPTKPAHKPPMGENMVVLPKHYARFEIEPVHFISVNGLTFLEGSTVKYTLRAPYKHDDGGRQDYSKAIRCIIMECKRRNGDPDWWKPYRNQALDAAIVQELSHAL